MEKEKVHSIVTRLNSASHSASSLWARPGTKEADGLKLSGTGHAQQGCARTSMGRERARLGAGTPFAPTSSVYGHGNE